MNPMILLLLTLVTAASAQIPYPEKLYCNRLTGNFVSPVDGGPVIQFGRPLEPGDKIIINGSKAPESTWKIMRMDIVDSSQTVHSFHMRTENPTDWPRMPGYFVFSANLGSGWQNSENGLDPYVVGGPMVITIEYTGVSYVVSSPAGIIHVFNLRNSPAIPMMYLWLLYDFTTNYVEMNCIRPLATTAQPTTARPRRTRRPGNGNGHGHGHGNGHGHGHGHGGGSDSSSSSSSEECFSG